MAVKNKKLEAEQLETQIAAMQKKLDQTRSEIEKETLNYEHIQKINGLLSTARAALKKAGEIGDQYGIEFTFNTPKGHVEAFRPGWQSSACYSSDGWFYDDR